MNEEIIKQLKNLIKENPPLDKKGKPKWWNTSDWEEKLNKEIPNWRELLKRTDIWKEIKGVKPRRDYDDLLVVILEYAPPEILKKYLTSDDSEERETAYSILIKDNAKKLTADFWKLLDNDTKIWLISKISENVLKRPYSRFLKELDILIHDPEYFFERIRRHKYLPGIYPYIIPLALTEIEFYENKNVLHPLWIKLKGTIEGANDLSSMKRIEEIERKFMERIQRVIEKLKAIFPIFQHQYPFISKNILFDPSLLLDYEKAKRAFNFMREYHKEFNFFISSSFYKILREENKWYKFVRFFEYEKEISPGEILGMLEEHRRYYTFFEIPREIYREKYAYFYRSLREEVEDRDLVEVLFEEWVFLQEFSWIVAKSKKTFEKFKKAGAVVLEISKKALDRLIEFIDKNKYIDKVARKKLGIPDEEMISIGKKLWGLGKWIAHGGVTAAGASFPNPVAGALFGYFMGEGFFVLIDPKEINITGKI